MRLWGGRQREGRRHEAAPTEAMLARMAFEARGWAALYQGVDRLGLFWWRSDADHDLRVGDEGGDADEVDRTF